MTHLDKAIETVRDLRETPYGSSPVLALLAETLAKHRVKRKA